MTAIDVYAEPGPLSGHAADPGAPRLGVRAVLPFALLVAVAAVVPGSAAKLAYLGGVVALAGWHFALGNLEYHAVVWLAFLFTPLVRRVIDYGAGWDPVNLVMVAPYAAAAFSFFTIARYAGLLLTREALPLLLALLGLAYGLFVGVVNAGPVPALYGFIEWAAPVALAFQLCRDWHRYDQLRAMVVNLILSAGAVVAVYGIVQFVAVTPWDAFWMDNAPIFSIGEPVPYKVRVFSTMNAPVLLSAFLVTAILVLLGQRGWWNLAVVGLLAGCLSLSLARSAWLGLAVGLLVMVLGRGLDGRKLGAIALVVAGLGVMAVTVEPRVADTVTERAASFSRLGRDRSFDERLRFHEWMLSIAVSNVAGEGFGSIGMSTKLNNAGNLGRWADFDSGIIALPYALGWPGMLLYGLGLGVAVRRALSRARADRTWPYLAGAAAMLSQVWSWVVFGSVGGFCLWFSLGMCLAAALASRRAR